jgi:hypothetical protein
MFTRKKISDCKNLKQTTLDTQKATLTSSTYPIHLLQAQRGGQRQCVASPSPLCQPLRIDFIWCDAGEVVFDSLSSDQNMGTVRGPKKLKSEGTKADVEVGTRDLKTVSNPVSLIAG